VYDIPWVATINSGDFVFISIEFEIIVGEIPTYFIFSGIEFGFGFAIKSP
jgi:hypothetical protein